MLPNLIVIGAQKSATTSLHFYLGLHPQIAMSRTKELNFFIRERNWNRGVDWYGSHFAQNCEIRGESSPAYTTYPFYLDVPERIRVTVPEARLIYLVRDPIERMISHYVHLYAADLEARPIEEAFTVPAVNPGQAYRERSRYHLQLEQYWRHFPPAQVLVLTQDELLRRRRQTLQRVFRFLGVDPEFNSPWFHARRHRSSEKRRGSSIGRSVEQVTRRIFDRLGESAIRHSLERWLLVPFSMPVERPRLTARLRGELVDYFRDDVTRLRASTGLALDSWCV
jgi:hypothetical protein